jgi:hypothetical protein
MSLGSRLVVTLVDAATSVLALALSLALSFALGPPGIIIGVAALAATPLVALRVAGLFTSCAAQVSTRAMSATE